MAEPRQSDPYILSSRGEQDAKGAVLLRMTGVKGGGFEWLMNELSATAVLLLTAVRLSRLCTLMLKGPQYRQESGTWRSEELEAVASNGTYFRRRGQ